MCFECNKLVHRNARKTVSQKNFKCKSYQEVLEKRLEKKVNLDGDMLEVVETFSYLGNSLSVEGRVHN